MLSTVALKNLAESLIIIKHRGKFVRRKRVIFGYCKKKSEKKKNMKNKFSTRKSL